MKIQLKKPSIHLNAMYPEGAVIDMTDEGRAKFFTQMGIGVAVDAKTPLSDAVEPPRALRSAHADQIGEAIVEGIAKANKASRKAQEAT